MRRRQWYLGLCILGTVLPYSQFIPFLHQHGLDLHLFIQNLFANQVSGFFAWDVIVSSIVLWTFIALEGRRRRVPHLWAPVLANILVGVSLGLPLFLYLRERRDRHHRSRAQDLD